MLSWKIAVFANILPLNPQNRVNFWSRIKNAPAIVSTRREQSAVSFPLSSRTLSFEILGGGAHQPSPLPALAKVAKYGRRARVNLHFINPTLLWRQSMTSNMVLTGRRAWSCSVENRYTKIFNKILNIFVPSYFQPSFNLYFNNPTLFCRQSMASNMVLPGSRARSCSVDNRWHQRWYSQGGGRDDGWYARCTGALVTDWKWQDLTMAHTERGNRQVMSENR